MAEQKSSSFHVVDKRTGSKKKAPQEAPAESKADPPAETSEPEEPIVDSESDSDSSGGGKAQPDDERALPDPSFLLSMACMQMETGALLQALIPILDGHAWRSMGFLADPRTGETAKNMPAAQLAIDAVQFLLGKVEAQMADGDRRDMQRRLSDLRMNYIAKLREP